MTLEGVGGLPVGEPRDSLPRSPEIQPAPVVGALGFFLLGFLFGLRGMSSAPHMPAPPPPLSEEHLQGIYLEKAPEGRRTLYCRRLFFPWGREQLFSAAPRAQDVSRPVINYADWVAPGRNRSLDLF